MFKVLNVIKIFFILINFITITGILVYPINKKNNILIYITNKKSLKSEKNIVFKQAIKLLNEKANYLKAKTIFSDLAFKNPLNTEYQYYACYSSALIGEMNYFPGKREPYDTALKFCKKAISLESKNPKYQLMLSYVYGRIGLFDKNKNKGWFSGLISLQRSISLINKILNAPSLSSISNSYYNKIIEKGEPFIKALITRAEVYRDAPTLLGGDKNTSIKILEHLYNRLPNHPRTLYVLARTYYKIQKPKKSENIYIQLKNLYKSNRVKKNPLNNYIFIHLPFGIGQLYWDTNRKKAACKKFNEYLNRHKRSGSAYEWLSRCRKNEGKINKAIKMIKLAIYYSPFNESYKNELKNLTIKKNKN